MEIHGFQKTTLLDYPGHVASTIFFGGCNFRCPYCHNGDLVLNPKTVPVIPIEQVMAHLKKRVNIIDGVCITGGEPTLQPDLEPLIRNIRELGYEIKLDTNGYRPDILKHLCESGLIDYVAMDIKHTQKKYNQICNKKDFQIDYINESVEFLKNGSVPYEFRTTVAKELHTKEDFIELASWLDGASAYYLQAYKESDQVLNPIFSSYSRKELDAFCTILRKHIKTVEIRGMDE